MRSDAARPNSSAERDLSRESLRQVKRRDQLKHRIGGAVLAAGLAGFAAAGSLALNTSLQSPSLRWPTADNLPDVSLPPSSAPSADSRREIPTPVAALERPDAQVVAESDTSEIDTPTDVAAPATPPPSSPVARAAGSDSPPTSVPAAAATSAAPPASNPVVRPASTATPATPISTRASLPTTTPTTQAPATTRAPVTTQAPPATPATTNPADIAPQPRARTTVKPTTTVIVAPTAPVAEAPVGTDPAPTSTIATSTTTATTTSTTTTTTIPTSKPSAIVESVVSAESQTILSDCGAVSVSFSSDLVRVLSTNPYGGFGVALDGSGTGTVSIGFSDEATACTVEVSAGTNGLDIVVYNALP